MFSPEPDVFSFCLVEIDAKMNLNASLKAPSWTPKIK